MSFSLPKYFGVNEHKMDPKFRVSIPSAWRPEDGEQLILRNLTDCSIPHIQVLTEAALAKAVADIEKTECTSGEIRDAIQLLYRSIQIVRISNQGKLQIPKEWSLQANIPAESKVILSGSGEYFEIYEPSVFAAIDSAQKSSVSGTMAHTHLFPK